MPKSSRRPAATRKAAAARRARQSHPRGSLPDKSYEFTRPPWDTWHEAQATGSPEDAMAVLVNLPFPVEAGGEPAGFMTLAELADSTGVPVCRQQELARIGFLAWDAARRVAILTTPPGG